MEIKERRRKRIAIGLSLLTVIMVGMIGACVWSGSQSSPDSVVDQLETPVERSGEVIIRDGSINVSDEMIEPIEDYVDDYFEAIARLESVEIKNRFVEPEGENARLNQAELDYMIKLRKDQNNDLSMISYLCGLTFVDIVESAGGVEVIVDEDHTVNFSFMPEIDSSGSGIRHTFVLKETESGYVISEHYRDEDSFLMIQSWVEDGYEPGEAADQLLEMAYLVVDSNNAEKEMFNNGEAQISEAQAEHSYNREAAVAYAMNWVDPIAVIRNENEYGVYDSYGGNCNNYISQCLFAGEIPMDTVGGLYEQWKWYGDQVNAYGAAGRSPSFTGVNEFYQYADENIGYGLEAIVDENLFSGQAGDILQYGYTDEWHHSVIIIDTVTDESGNVVDYLINSNTTDRINYPASAYGYPQMRLIKILGWNES